MDVTPSRRIGFATSGRWTVCDSCLLAGVWTDNTVKDEGEWTLGRLSLWREVGECTTSANTSALDRSGPGSSLDSHLHLDHYCVNSALVIEHEQISTRGQRKGRHCNINMNIKSFMDESLAPNTGMRTSVGESAGE
eukprot:scaffold30_cov416-Prasinococcus_capsulatus_cf.AAC.5